MKNLILLVLAAAGIVFASDAQQILNNLKEKYSAIIDFSAELKQEGNAGNLSGRLFYKKDNKFRLELKNSTIVSDGQTIWNHNKKENKVVVSEAGVEQNMPFSFETLLNDYPSKSNLSSTQEGAFDVLTLTPKPGSGLNFKSVRIWVNKNNLVEKIFIENQAQAMRFRISDYKINQNISDSKFNFESPEGSKVIDLR